MPVPALSGSSFIANVGQLGVLPADGADSCVLSFGAVQGFDSDSPPPKPVPITVGEIATGALNISIERLGTAEQRRIAAALTRRGGGKEVGTRRQLWVKAPEDT
jgi:hypothetical protein